MDNSILIDMWADWAAGLSELCEIRRMKSCPRGALYWFPSRIYEAEETYSKSQRLTNTAVSIFKGSRRAVTNSSHGVMFRLEPTDSMRAVAYSKFRPIVFTVSHTIKLWYVLGADSVVLVRRVSTGSTCLGFCFFIFRIAATTVDWSFGIGFGKCEPCTITSSRCVGTDTNVFAKKRNGSRMPPEAHDSPAGWHA